MTPPLDRARWIFVGVFVVTLAVHLVAIAHPASTDTSSALRHALFAAINGSFALLFARGVRWLFFPLVALSLQQGYSHGSELVRAAQRGEVDVQSALVLVFLPVALLYAWRRLYRQPSAS